MGTSWENWGTSWVKQAKTMKKNKEILGQTLKNTSKNNWNQPESLQTPQEAPRQPAGSPKRAQNLQKAPPGDPKPSQKGTQIDAKIDEKSIQEAPKTPKSSQGRSKSDLQSICCPFWIDFGNKFETKIDKKARPKSMSFLIIFLS